MKISILKKQLGFAALFVATSLFFTACSKSDDPAPNEDSAVEEPGTLFKASDFEIYDMERSDITYAENYILYFYKVKNTTDRDYKDNSENGRFDVLFRVKGSDGAWYDSRNSIPDINAGASDEESLDVSCPEGITFDESTFTYEVVVAE